MLPAFAECLVLVGIHSYLGLHVIRRKVIFVDLALAQIAAMGTVVAFTFGHEPGSAVAFVFSLAAATVYLKRSVRQQRPPSRRLLRAFSKGADGVFIGGCHLGECNYMTHGNYHALNLVLLARHILAHIGIDPQRLQIEFMSGGEGIVFAEVVDTFVKQVKELGPLGEAEGLDQTALDTKLAEVTRLVPYIKIEKHTKLTARLENEAQYEEHFTGEEIDRLFDEVVSYYIDPEKCQACMICQRRCPVDAIDGGKKRIHVIDQDQCIKCGSCLSACPSRFGAVGKIVGGPVPPYLPEEKRLIAGKVKG